jgi:alcohol dehydrogenase (NADP+)
MHTVNCLFVGAGAISEEYAAGLSETSLSLAGVCDLDGERARALASAYDCPHHTDLDAALRAVDAPLVVNLTSHAAHAAVTRTALDAGRHVYSQKPLALDEENAADLLDTAEQNGLALGGAPEPEMGPTQQRAAALLADGRVGTVRLGYAHAHVGRVTDWHDRPASFLEIGPLYDGGVYPLSLLASWFGPVSLVRVADTLDVWPDRTEQQPEAPSHVEAMLEFAAGPTVRLTASFYAPHRSREFYGLELHGDDGSLYLDGTGAMETSDGDLRFGGVGRSYTPVPPQSPPQAVAYVDAVERLADSIERGQPDRTTGQRAAHVVAICNAIERAAASGDPVTVPAHGVTADTLTAPTAAAQPVTDETRALRLPAVGFGCSRYRDGTYVDRIDSIATALDAGYRLFDSAELYGNEHRIGDLLAAPGSPDREHLFLVGKVWRTNHRRDHLLAACAGSRDELGIDAFDCYMLHWPKAWAHRGALDRLAKKPVPEQERLTFPETDEGSIETDDISLADAWRNLETVAKRGWAKTLGVCNVSRQQLETVLETGAIDPAIVQIERHPYTPQRELVEFCHERGIRVLAHSPLSAPGLLEESILADVGSEHGLSPAGVVLAWNVTKGVVPIPSSNTPAHIVDNLAAGATRLTPAACRRVGSLCDPGFER